MLMLALPLLLTACATAPVVNPVLPELALEPQEPTFQKRMQDFLRGKLPEPTKP
jgi:hypothetical protein